MNVLVDLFELAKCSMDLHLSAREKIESFGGVLERSGYNVYMAKKRKTRRETYLVGKVLWEMHEQGRKRTRRSTRLFANSKRI